jgi:hypothetical protein
MLYISLTTTRIAPQQHIVGNDNDMCIYRRPQPPSPLQRYFRTPSPRLSPIIAPDPSPKRPPDPQISQVLLNPNSRRHKSSNPPSLLVRRSVDDPPRNHGLQPLIHLLVAAIALAYNSFQRTHGDMHRREAQRCQDLGTKGQLGSQHR